MLALRVPRAALRGCAPRTVGAARSVHTFPDHVTIDAEVKDAVLSNKPVVALESTILTHGIPFPHNVAMARDLNALIRDSGAVPATIALVKGRPVVGASDAEIEYLCTPPPRDEASFIKISRRDIAYAVAHGVTGGTTIAGTMILAHLAGIRVFATGGLGGVHRGAESTLDISADLEELGRTPVAVVSAGAKAILDLAKTFEYLETKGVHVSTYGPPGTNVPAFYSRDSGIHSPFNFSTPEEAAAVIHANTLLKLQSGMLFCVPPPHEFAIPSELIDDAIDRAVIDANEARIAGKDLTPFLLNRIFEITDGRSLSSNIGFVKNNILMGAKIAVALSKYEQNPSAHYQPSILIPRPSPSNILGTPSSSTPPSVASPDCLVVGAIAVDITCDLPHAHLKEPSTYHHTSNPGAIHRTPGGVGFNVCLAATYAAASMSPVVPQLRMVSAVGPDARDLPAALGLSASQTQLLPDLSGVAVYPEGRTAQYIAMHDAHGGLILACADMDLVENMPLPHLATEFARAGTAPSWVAVDANLNIGPLRETLRLARTISNARVMLEPTAVIKARAILDIAKEYLAPLPDDAEAPTPVADVFTPNDIELASLFAYARDIGLFEAPQWWRALHSFAITSSIRDAFPRLTRGDAALTNALLTGGVLQMCLHFLPYFPNLFVKLGPLGVISSQLLPPSAADTMPAGKDTETLVTADRAVIRWRTTTGSIVVLAHHAAAVARLPPSEIISVTGAGDSFAGVLLAELVAAAKRESVADGGAGLHSLYELHRIVNRAQRASVLTLKSRLAVAPEIAMLEP
ncbi:Indigoidine synthase A like protein-domain-containing protein [Limtongia smithiae]|uniref:Indigoidine synthase A like protein-domain-containing protein n=1 Tax=Limtongia smithiae TaxID=1125753 RepID=UPI0034CF73B5